MVTEKQYCYILLKYHFYDCKKVLMVSSSHDEIITYFTRELRKLRNDEGLTVSRYEFGKYNTEKHIRWVEREDGKIKDLKGDV